MPVRFLSRLVPLTLSVLFLGMTATGAYAYLDAGTGSMILQVLLGGIAGLLIAGKLYWHKFLSLVGLRRDPPQTDEAKDEPTVGQ
ncbi:hypothetical protein [Chelativorans salis]|uniref:Uncharacterized protein n=1 Tax=Chelativorans salis TaxID=2978478 RepID=A0ABT2LV69_9HYPH|nr:hypothetical protein [Chelativorans sp. EGI FJ00035]MCT7378426.1 hypothetical protein [Chelativorans sp. EGI FJ00035]